MEDGYRDAVVALRLRRLWAQLASLFREALDAWGWFRTWFNIGWHSGRPAAVLERLAAVGQAVLLIWFCHGGVTHRTSLDGALAWLVAGVLALMVVCIVGTPLLVRRYRGAEEAAWERQPKRSKPRSGLRKVAFKLTRQQIVGVRVMIVGVPVWLAASLILHGHDMWEKTAGLDVSRRWTWLVVLMVVPAIKAWDRLDRWRGEWETHTALARDAAASRELLATAAPLAAADQLTPIAMGNLLGIAVGDDLTATACAARRVLVALHQDPDAVDLATPLEPQEMERIWAATEKLRVASPTPAPSWAYLDALRFGDPPGA